MRWKLTLWCKNLMNPSMVWMRMALMPEYLVPDWWDLFGNDKEMWPCWRRKCIAGCGLWGFNSPCHFKCLCLCPLFVSHTWKRHRVLYPATVPAHVCLATAQPHVCPATTPAPCLPSDCPNPMSAQWLPQPHVCPATAPASCLPSLCPVPCQPDAMVPTLMVLNSPSETVSTINSFCKLS